MSIVKLKAHGLEFEGNISELLVGPEGAKSVETTLIIPKNKGSLAAFTGWRRDQGIVFDCESHGMSELFLVEETSSHFIFMNA